LACVRFAYATDAIFRSLTRAACGTRLTATAAVGVGFVAIMRLVGTARRYASITRASTAYAIGAIVATMRISAGSAAASAVDISLVAVFHPVVAARGSAYLRFAYSRNAIGRDLTTAAGGAWVTAAIAATIDAGF
jgi:hypothetical protein